MANSTGPLNSRSLKKVLTKLPWQLIIDELIQSKKSIKAFWRDDLPSLIKPFLPTGYKGPSYKTFMTYVSPYVSRSSHRSYVLRSQQDNSSASSMLEPVRIIDCEGDCGDLDQENDFSLSKSGKVTSSSEVSNQVVLQTTLGTFTFNSTDPDQFMLTVVKLLSERNEDADTLGSVLLSGHQSLNTELTREVKHAD